MSNGGISLHDIEDMPIDKYLIVREAAEIEEINHRLQLILDINAAFSGNKEHIDNLQMIFRKLVKEDVIQAQADPNWQSRLARYKR